MDKYGVGTDVSYTFASDYCLILVFFSFFKNVDYFLFLVLFNNLAYTGDLCVYC